MAAASVASAAVSKSRTRLYVLITLVVYCLGLLVMHLPGGSVPGRLLVSLALLLSITVAPPEFALGALGCAFLAATTRELWPWFESLRWFCLAGAAFALTLRLSSLRKGRTLPIPNRFVFLMVLFVGFSMASLTVTQVIGLSALKLGALVVLFYTASRGGVFLVELYGPGSARRLAVGLAAYLLPLVVLSALSFWSGSGATIGAFGRYAGYFGHPNGCAVLLVTLLPWAACGLFRRRRLDRRALALLAGILVLIYFLLLTVARASILGLIATVAVFCLLHASRRIGVIAVLGAVFFTTRLLVQPDLLDDLAFRYLYKHRHEADVFQSREQPWAQSKRSFEQRPWLGFGFGVTTESQADWSIGFRTVSHNVETGSSFWFCLNQVGLVGSAPLFLAVLLFLARAARFAWRAKDPWFTAIFASCLALVINACFEGWLIAPGGFPATYFWIQAFFLSALMCRFRPAPARRPALAHQPVPGQWAHSLR